jgi:hypothetical protein
VGPITANSHRRILTFAKKCYPANDKDTTTVTEVAAKTKKAMSISKETHREKANQISIIVNWTAKIGRTIFGLFCSFFVVFSPKSPLK